MSQSIQILTSPLYDAKILSEAIAPGSVQKRWYIQGIFIQCDKKNKNGRVYPLSVVKPVVTEYINQFVNHSRAFGELGHPDGPVINPERISHLTTSLVLEGTDYIGKAKILTTPYGKITQSLLEEGSKLAVSSRGFGSTSRDYTTGAEVVQDDFKLTSAADIVIDPSAPDAFVDALMEQRKWLYDSTEISTKTLDKMRKTIGRSPARQLKEQKIDAFKNFLESLYRNKY
jgi:hypothetical protein